MDFMEETIQAPCFMRHYIDGKIIFRDADHRVSYEVADAVFYRHRHAAEQRDTRPANELGDETMERIDVMLMLETKASFMLDVIQHEDDNVIFSPNDEPNALFQASDADFVQLGKDPELVAQLYDFVAPRGLEDPYCVQIENGDLIVY